MEAVRQHNWPVRVTQGYSGYGVVAIRELGIGELVCRFDGPCVAFADIPLSELRHALWIDSDRWMIPSAPARFINHGCEPNCVLGEDPTDADASMVIATRPIATGEEITFAYDQIDAEEWRAHCGDPLYAWHPSWSFDCRCGAPSCRGRVDGYRIVERGTLAPDLGSRQRT